jgi:predicted deacylase
LFLLETVVLLDEYDGDAFDEALIKPWLALEKYLAILGKPMRFEVEAYTLELGSGMQLNPASVAKGLRGVKNYLTAKRMLHLPITPSIQPHPTTFTQRSQLRRYYAPGGGIVQARVPLGAMVQAQQRLYQLLSFNKEGTLPVVLDIYAECSGRVYDVATNQAVNEGEYVIGIFPT